MRLTRAAACLCLTLVPLAGCGEDVAALGCDEIAGRAKHVSEGQEMKIKSLANVSETSRTAHDVRCRADATWSDNATTPVYVRAYDEGENRMVAYQATPFE
ncbi:MAG TPA: hypothetical protein VLK25_01110 [Allosphingosinicella sp.]|nr:hypothetical protein [Allosphingosinicella sp.]